MNTVPRDDYFVTLLDSSGDPPCRPPDDCDVCRLFDGQQSDESRSEWLARITGYTRTSLEEAS